MDTVKLIKGHKASQTVLIIMIIIKEQENNHQGLYSIVELDCEGDCFNQQYPHVLQCFNFEMILQGLRLSTYPITHHNCRITLLSRIL